MWKEENVLEEGAYYVWKKTELQKIIRSDYDLFSEYYNINDYGFWEHENYNLIRSNSDKEFADKNSYTRHITAVHGVKMPHKCSICDTNFTLYTNLRKHMKHSMTTFKKS